MRINRFDVYLLMPEEDVGNVQAMDPKEMSEFESAAAMAMMTMRED